MSNEEKFNTLRGITLGAGIDFEEKNELLNFITDIENKITLVGHAEREDLEE